MPESAKDKTIICRKIAPEDINRNATGRRKLSCPCIRPTRRAGRIANDPGIRLIRTLPSRNAVRNKPDGCTTCPSGAANACSPAPRYRVPGSAQPNDDEGNRTVQSDCPPPAKTPNAPRPQPSKTGATRETVRTPPTATVVHRVAGAPRSEIRCPIRGTAPHRNTGPFQHEPQVSTGPVGETGKPRYHKASPLPDTPYKRNSCGAAGP